MAQFVILYFGDDARAEAFVESTKTNVVGVYDDPRHRSCKCKDQPQKDYGWGPHNKFHGWQTHSRCGRAGKWWRAGYGKRMFNVFGVNKLPREKTPAIMQSPAGWGHEAYNDEAGVERG